MIRTMDMRTAQELSKSVFSLTDALFLSAITDCDRDDVLRIRENIRQARDLLNHLEQYAEDYLNGKGQVHFYDAK